MSEVLWLLINKLGKGVSEWINYFTAWPGEEYHS